MSFSFNASTSASSSVSPAVAQGCLTLFALPFAGVGVFVLAQAVRLAMQGELAKAAPLGGFGAVFAIAGFGLIIAGFKARKEVAARQAREAAAPGQPWLWREDWANRRIEDRSSSAATGLWFFALFWNLIAFPATYLVFKNGLESGNKAALLILFFPVVGLALLAAAVHGTLRARRYGRSVLELVAVPVPVGREIAGRIRVPSVFEPEQGVKVTLTCAREITTRNGKNTSTSTSVLWQDEQVIPGVSRDAGGISIPFAMAIPADCEQTDDSNPSNKVIWRLGASAVMAGVDYESSFDVPVFHTAESDAPLPPELVERERTRLAEYVLPADAPVRLTESGRGIDVEFPMGRNPGVATGITVFAVVWTGVVYALFRLEAPWFFRVVFALMDALLIGVMLWLWFGHASLHADPSGLTIDSGIGPFRRVRRFAPDEVTGFKSKVGMTAGNKAYFDLRLVFKDGSESAVGSGLTDQRQVEWVGERLLATLGGAGGEGGDRT